MSGWDRARASARLLCTAALGAMVAAPALAQQTTPPPPQVQPGPPAELDPSAPLDPLPDLGVDWPDLKAVEAPPVATPVANAPAEAASTSRYTLTIQGLEPVGDAQGLLTSFRQQSALEADRKDPANAAQIERRSRADADLLEQLLRSEGYYDADVEAQTRLAGDVVEVVLEVAPGEQYRFASVDLPGLQAAGPDAATLRQTFAVKAGDPVIAADVLAAGIALKTALGRQGFAEANIGDQDIAVDHRTHLA